MKRQTKQKMKRVMVLMLVLSMLVGMVPMNVFGTDTSDARDFTKLLTVIEQETPENRAEVIAVFATPGTTWTLNYTDLGDSTIRGQWAEDIYQMFQDSTETEINDLVSLPFVQDGLDALYRFSGTAANRSLVDLAINTIRQSSNTYTWPTAALPTSDLKSAIEAKTHTYNIFVHMLKFVTEGTSIFGYKVLEYNANVNNRTFTINSNFAGKIEELAELARVAGKTEYETRLQDYLERFEALVLAMNSLTNTPQMLIDKAALASTLSAYIDYTPITSSGVGGGGGGYTPPPAPNPIPNPAPNPDPNPVQNPDPNPVQNQDPNPVTNPVQNPETTAPPVNIPQATTAEKAVIAAVQSTLNNMTTAKTQEQIGTAVDNGATQVQNMAESLKGATANSVVIVAKAGEMMNTMSQTLARITDATQSAQMMDTINTSLATVLNSVKTSDQATLATKSSIDVVNNFTNLITKNTTEAQATVIIQKATVALESVSSNIGKITDAVQSTAAVNNVMKAVETTLTKVTNSEQATTAINSAIKVVDNAAIKTENQSTAQLNNNVEKTASTFNAISTALSKVTNVEQATKIVGDVVSVAASAVSKAQEEAVGNFSIQKAASLVAQAVVEKVNNVETESVVVDNVQSVVVDEQTMSAIEATMQTVMQTVAGLNNTLSENNIETKTEAVLNFSAVATTAPATEVGESPSVETPSSVNFSLPPAVFAKAEQAGIGKVSVDTGLASVSMPPAMFSNETGTSVDLVVKSVDNATQTSTIRNIVGNNPVYDFTLNVGNRAITQFNEPVSISIPFTGANTRFLTVFYVAPNGMMKPVPSGRLNSTSKNVNFKTNHFSMFTLKENHVTFSDLENSEWSREMVEQMASKGIIAGMGPDQFAPSQNLTRAQFVTLLVKMFDIPMAQNFTQKFTDVTRTDWFFQNVYTAYAEGLIKGMTDTLFAPSEKISRQDMAVIIKNAWDKYGSKLSGDASYLKNFVDKSGIKSYATDAVGVAVKLGVIRGNNEGMFNPTGSATRAEAAAVISKLYDAME